MSLIGEERSSQPFSHSSWSLAELLSMGLRQRPDGVALVAEGEEFTYRDLDDAAWVCADTLAELGVKVGDRVAHFASKSAADVVVALAVARLGATWAPLDSAAPLQRVVGILSDLEPKVVVAGGATKSTLGQAFQTTPCLELREVQTRVTLAPDTPRRRTPSIASTDVAYIIFTSGSTGAPKGVQITHGSLHHFLDAENSCMKMTSDARMLNTSPFHFDVVIGDLFFPLYQGACVWLSQNLFLRRTMLETLSQNQISHLTLPMSKLVLLTGEGGEDLVVLAPHLRFINTGAESVDPKVVRTWLRAIPGLTVINGYGPTEATSECIVNPITDPDVSDQEVSCIGRPLPGSKALLVDSTLQVIESAGEGEVVLGGPQLMKGYLKRPRETEASLIEINGDTYYRTGDLCRRDEDGRFFFLGRTDDEVKVQGYRVHLNEVRAALVEHQDVSEVIVAAVRSGTTVSISAAIVAKVVRDNTAREILRSASLKLPSYMTPSQLLVCESLPRLPSGKLDVKSASAALQRVKDVHPRAIILRATHNLEVCE